MSSKITFAAIVVALLTGCSHAVMNETLVNEDGSLKKSFRIEYDEIEKGVSERRLGISAQNGWTRSEVSRESSIDSANSVAFTKFFPSTSALNNELGRRTDTTLVITTDLKKKFRWFFTYIYYTETYHPANTMHLPIDRYITREDSMFVDRLPAEGKKISFADSLYLAVLNDKLFETYGSEAITEEYVTAVKKAFRSQNIEPRWYDTLSVYKKELFEQLAFDESGKSSKLLQMLDSLGIPLDFQEVLPILNKEIETIDSKIEFISWASSGTFRNVIHMPWKIIENNADSISGNRLYYNPPPAKFLFKDYKMYVIARKVNYWAFAVSFVIVGLTITLFARKKGK